MSKVFDGIGASEGDRRGTRPPADLGGARRAPPVRRARRGRDGGREAARRRCVGEGPAPGPGGVHGTTTGERGGEDLRAPAPHARRQEPHRCRGALRPREPPLGGPGPRLAHARAPGPVEPDGAPHGPRPHQRPPGPAGPAPASAPRPVRSHRRVGPARGRHRRHGPTSPRASRCRWIPASCAASPPTRAHGPPTG